MNKICCFAGHNDFLPEQIGDKIYSVAENLIINHGVTEFFVGNYGNFDMLCAKTINQLKKIYPFIKLTLVIPYLTEKINGNKDFYYKTYDDIVIAEIPENTPYKFKILKCNEYMVSHSDFLICYVIRGWGGAVKTLEYALKQKKIKVINLGIL